MTPEQIAAEVSAKYGLPVSPDAVKIIPQGKMATAIEYVWNGFQLKNASDENLVRKAANARWENYKRNQKFAAAPKERKVHPQIIKSQERRAEVSELAASGYDFDALAKHFACTESAMRKFCRKWQIKVTHKRRPSGRSAKRDERRAKVMEFAQAGDKTVRQIADFLGCTWAAAQEYCRKREIPYRRTRTLQGGAQ